MFKFKKRDYISEIDVFLNSVRLARATPSLSQQAEIEYCSCIEQLRDHVGVVDVCLQQRQERINNAK